MTNKYYGENLFEKETISKLLDRVAKLTPETQRLWGKMSVDQMLAHLAETLEVALGHKHIKRGFLSYWLGPMVKTVFLNPRPLAKSAPTSKEFIIAEARDFEMEKQRTEKLLQEFQAKGPSGVTKDAHAFFGRLIPDQWARGMFKHTDHHLRQFGA